MVKWKILYSSLSRFENSPDALVSLRRGESNNFQASHKDNLSSNVEYLNRSSLKNQHSIIHSKYIIFEKFHLFRAPSLQPKV
jgi:hypothetical protein